MAGVDPARLQHMMDGCNVGEWFYLDKIEVVCVCVQEIV